MATYAKYSPLTGPVNISSIVGGRDISAVTSGGVTTISSTSQWRDPVANMAALPATGNTSGDVRVTLDSGIIWEWNGSTWITPVEGAPVWGTITGTLSSQTDLQTALNAKAPTNNPTFTGTIGTSLTANEAVVTDGSGNLAAYPYSATSAANSIVSRNSAGYTYLTNLTQGFTTNSAGGSIILGSSASHFQVITGSGNTTINLPGATGLLDGTVYEFNNNSTGTVSIQYSDSSSFISMVPGSYLRIILANNSTGNGVWDYHWELPPSAVYGTAGLTVTGNVTASSMTDSGLTASTALIADGSKNLASSSTTSTELGYVHGVTSAIQTQLNNKYSFAYTLQPGGTASGNVYTSWSSLYSAISALPTGQLNSVLFDNSAGSCTIPSGSYNLNYTEIQGITGPGKPSQVPVTISSGVTLSGPFAIGEGLILESAVSAPAITMVQSSLLPFGVESGFNHSGSGHFIEYTALSTDTTQITIYGDTGSTFTTSGSNSAIYIDGNANGGSSPAIIYIGAAGNLGSATDTYETLELAENSVGVVFLYPGAYIANNAIRGPSSSIVLVVYLAGLLAPITSSPVVGTQANFAGTLANYYSTSTFSGTIPLAKLTGGGTNGSISVTAGIITNVTNPT